MVAAASKAEPSSLLLGSTALLELVDASTTFLDEEKSPARSCAALTSLGGQRTVSLRNLSSALFWGEKRRTQVTEVQ